MKLKLKKLNQFREFFLNNEILSNEYFWLIVFLPFFFISSSLDLKVFSIALILGFTLLRTDFFSSVYFTFLILLPVNKQFFSLFKTIVPRNTFSYLSGYGINVGLYPRTILVIILFFLLVGIYKKKVWEKVITEHIYLISFLFFSFLSTLYSGGFWISKYGLSEIVGSVAIFFCSYYLIVTKVLTRRVFLSYSTALLFILGLIGSAQFFLQRQLGLFVESRGFESIFDGTIVTDGFTWFRSSGLSTHATSFGVLISVLLLIKICHVIEKRFKPSILEVGAIFLGLLSLFATFSRSSWLSFSISMILAFFWRFNNFKIFSKEIGRWLKINLKKGRYLAAIVIAIFLVLAVSKVIFTSSLLRLSSLTYYWTSGNGVGRAYLVDHSLIMIKNYPIFGVGLHNFTAQMVKQGVSSQHAGFIFPVHNLFLLLASELGVFATLSLILFFTVLMVKSLVLNKSNDLILGLWLSILSFLINSQFHIIFAQGEILDFVMVITGIMSGLLVITNRSHK